MTFMAQMVRVSHVEYSPQILMLSKGPIAMSYTFKVTRVHTEMLDALEKLGIPRNLDNVRNLNVQVRLM